MYEADLLGKYLHLKRHYPYTAPRNRNPVNIWWNFYRIFIGARPFRNQIPYLVFSSRPSRFLVPLCLDKFSPSWYYHQFLHNFLRKKLSSFNHSVKFLNVKNWGQIGQNIAISQICCEYLYYNKIEISTTDHRSIYLWHPPHTVKQIKLTLYQSPMRKMSYI